MLLLFRKFHKCLNRRPMITQMLISCGISCGGDITAQYLDGLKEWDKMRTLRFCTLLGAFIIPPQIMWYRILQRVQSTNRHIQVAKRVTYDQLIFSPICCATILMGLPVLQGDTFKQSISKMKNDWFDVYVNSLKIWPIVQIFNFYFMPLNYRVILIQTVGFIWSAYLSLKTSHQSLK